jgi:adenosine kinase
MIREKTGLTEESVSEALDALIITLGERGSTIFTGDGQISVPIVPPAQIIDPTGVGDAYRAGVLKGLALDAPWECAGQMGAVAAAYVLEERGTQNHTYTRPGFVARYRQFFDDGGLLDAMLDR